MAKGRLSMRKKKEIFRLKFDQMMSNRKIAKSCGTSHSVVADYLCRATKAGLDWLQIAKMDDAEIEEKLFLHKAKDTKSGRRMPVMENIHVELKKKGVTLQLLWNEYKYDNPKGYQYSQYCELYRRWSQKLDVSLRQQHRAGKKLFIDYAGHTHDHPLPDQTALEQMQLCVTQTVPNLSKSVIPGI